MSVIVDPVSPQACIIQLLAMLVGAYTLFRILLSWAAAKRFTPLRSGAVLLTGTSSGIGRRTALFLAKQGFVVLAGVRKQADGDALVKEGGSNIHPVILDVAVQNSIDECFKTVVAFLKEQALPLVCVINNAGLLQDSTVEFHDMAQMKTMFDVNYYGLVAVTQKFLPLIRKSKGRIINIGSVAGRVTFARYGAYSASKFAVEAISDALRVELEEYGVAVALIQPGFCKTELFKRGTGAATTKATDSHAATTNVAKEVLDVYGDLYRPAFEAKSRAPMEGGSDAGVVVDAVYHALTSAYPKSRYPVAKINKAPVSVVFFIRAFLPDRLWDRQLRRC